MNDTKQLNDFDDPFQRLYDAIAAEKKAEVLERPHDKDTMRYERRPPLRFRASEAGACARRIWYRLVGCVPAPDSPQLVMTQIEGNVAQDVIRELFRQYKIPIEDIKFHDDGTQEETASTIREFDVDGETVKVSCRSDGLFPETPHGPARFEFKTIDDKKAYWYQQAYKGYWSKKVPARGDKPLGKGLPAVAARIKLNNPYYYNQVQTTMAVFDDARTAFGMKNRSAVSFGIELADGRRSMVYFDANPEDQQQILRQFAAVQRAVCDDEAPAPLLADSRECGFCSFHYQCHGRVQRGELVYPE